MFEEYTCIIVGAGLFGAVAAERLAHRGEKVCVLEKRAHIGGNCHDAPDKDTGILVHTYGPHIFHASDEEVLRYVHRFAEFNRYFHQVVAVYRDRVYQLPFNLETINTFYNINLRPYEMEAFLQKETEREKITQPQNMEEKAISLIGRPLYEAFIRDYTTKQWGRPPRDLPSDTIKRIPIRSSYYECYYNKAFHGLPVGGYTNMIERMLTHENIRVFLNTDYFAVKESLPRQARLLFTGPIDAFFGFSLGRLEYRQVRFERETHPVRDWQGTSVVNYPEPTYPYTRICEPRHFYLEKWDEYSPNQTVIVKEFSLKDNGENPCYPIRDALNADLADRYAQLGAEIPNVVFGGRLGSYRYYDMEDAIKAALLLTANWENNI